MAYYEINNGFETNILEGKSKALIHVYYQKNNENISVISDIIAGHIMFDVCLNKSIRVYKTMGKNYDITSEKAYRTFLKKLRNDTLFNFQFDMSYVHPKSGGTDLTQTKLDNKLLYQQALVGMMGFLLSFLIMFFVYSMAEPQNLVRNRRVKITLIPGYVIYLGQVLTAVILSFILSALVTAFILVGMETRNLSLALPICLLIHLYCVLLSVIFVLIGRCCKGAASYQTVGSALILSYGIIGTAGVIIGEQSKELLNISKIIPNYWFIKEFTDIIINGVL
jgi:ABC-2 type transport system permease protein